jgi:hypothetical protein
MEKNKTKEKIRLDVVSGTTLGEVSKFTVTYRSAGRWFGLKRYEVWDFGHNLSVRLAHKPVQFYLRQ